MSDKLKLDWGKELEDNKVDITYVCKILRGEDKE